MPLEEYRRKRRFDRTPEPAGKPVRREGRRFVVQKHAARRLHYDLRLEIDGVLKSWAVPKGPSLDPGEKRLAVETEDHPMDYGGFEGTIPEGNYGAGTVMVWDRGAYRVAGDLPAREQLARGELKFELDGRKLQGGFVLVKLKRSEKGNEWLLIKHKDAFAAPGWDIEQHDGSALSGRTLSEIRDGLPPSAAARPVRPEELEGAREAKMPARIAPMLATLAERPFSDPEWLFEVKWDGVRALAWVRDGALELRSRTERIITAQYPELEELPERLEARQAILDGEIVVLDGRGRSDFERLQQRMHVRKPAAALQQQAPVTYYLFDILYCDGWDLRAVPLAERKGLLRRMLRARDPFRYSGHQPEKGAELFELARQQQLEGILGKHARSPYVSRRSPYWVKFKVRSELDAVVGGWTAPRGSREHFGALLLGLYDDRGLQYIGSVGSGFTEKTQREVTRQLEKLATKSCPFVTPPDTQEKAAWVKPQLVAQVEYASWTQERRLRAPVFLRLRDDLPAEECRVETEIPAARPPSVVAAPAVTGRLLSTKEAIERELFSGREETVTVELDGRRVRLSNLNKVYFPESRITKRHLLAYYYRMADVVLRYLHQRPLVLRRYPDGIRGEAFFQKDAGDTFPEWLETAGVYSEEKKREVRYFVANDRAALLYLVNLGCIDHNPWFSRTDDLDRPDYIAFDLDPAEGASFRTVVAVARAVWEKLQALGLQPFVKTSGATGMHIFLPIERRYTYEQARTFAEIVARLVTAENPKLATMERAVEKRKRDSVYVDVFQNAHGRPLAAAYTVRAFPRAPVSTPLEFSELKPGLRPERFNLKNTEARLEKRGDPWARFWESRQTLERAIAALGEHVTPKKR